VAAHVDALVGWVAADGGISMMELAPSRAGKRFACPLARLAAAR